MPVSYTHLDVYKRQALGGVVTSCVSVGSIGAAAGALGLVAFLYCVIVLIPRLRIART